MREQVVLMLFKNLTKNHGRTRTAKIAAPPAEQPVEEQAMSQELRHLTTSTIYKSGKSGATIQYCKKLKRMQSDGGSLHTWMQRSVRTGMDWSQEVEFASGTSRRANATRSGTCVSQCRRLRKMQQRSFVAVVYENVLFGVHSVMNIFAGGKNSANLQF